MWLLFALDAGPRQTLEALASEAGFAWAEQRDDLTAWRDCMQSVQVRGVVVGTSRSETGAMLEAQCRIAAKEAGLPLAAVEDYPGNYQHIPGGEAGLLIVESDLAATAAQQRLGGACPETTTGASFRYDPLRARSLSASIPEARKGGWILWAGQPETEDALLSLPRLLPIIQALGMKLLFRAHPRDAGLTRGDYAPLFAPYSGLIRDVSGLSLEAVLELRPCLTLTQFSSLAIELGFLGIPAAHVLYSDAGQARLRALTGYGIPHVCEAGGSVKITDQNEPAQVLQQAIFDKPARGRMMRCFDAFFDVQTPQTPLVARCLKSFFEQ